MICWKKACPSSIANQDCTCMQCFFFHSQVFWEESTCNIVYWPFFLFHKTAWSAVLVNACMSQSSSLLSEDHVNFS